MKEEMLMKDLSLKNRKMLDALEKKIPNLRHAIKTLYTSSPLSYRDYIGNCEGNMYGYMKSSENPLKTMVSPRTKIDNLFSDRTIREYAWHLRRYYRSF